MELRGFSYFLTKAYDCISHHNMDLTLLSTRKRHRYVACKFSEACGSFPVLANRDGLDSEETTRYRQERTVMILNSTLCATQQKIYKYCSLRRWRDIVCPFLFTRFLNIHEYRPRFLYLHLAVKSKYTV